MRFRFLPIVVAMLLGMPGTVSGAEETRLDSAEIETAITGKTAVYTGGDQRQYFAADGRTPYWDGRRLTHGNWWTAGNRYCSIWPPSPAQSCYKVFRTDKGEIVWVGDRNDRYVATMRDGDQMP